jgi:hypothetical protein
MATDDSCGGLRERTLTDDGRLGRIDEHADHHLADPDATTGGDQRRELTHLDRGDPVQVDRLAESRDEISRVHRRSDGAVARLLRRRVRRAVVHAVDPTEVGGQTLAMTSARDHQQP